MQQKETLEICKLCNKVLKNKRALWSHLSKYHDKSFSENSAKKYYDLFISTSVDHKCKNPSCNNNTKYIGLTNGYANTCCKKCSDILNGLKRKGISTGKPSPNKGKKDSLETRMKKKLAALKFHSTEYGKQLAKKWSEKQKGKNNTCHKISESKKKEIRKKQSNTIKKLILEGKFTPNITNSWANSKVPLKIFGFTKYYRSTWDAVFQILNPNTEYEKIRIPYVYNEQQHCYIVDFVDEQKRILYEIKPDILKTSELNLIKINATILWCEKNNYSFKIISNEYFEKNAKNVNYNLYDKKIKDGMKQFL